MRTVRRPVAAPVRPGFFSALALTALALVSFTATANAGWSYESVKWRHLGRGALGFSENGTARICDTLYVSAAPARVDTTAAWSMLDCDNLFATEQGQTATTADSLAPAYVVIQADSSVASSVNFKNTTVTIQVNYGTSSAGWQTLHSALSPLATDGTKTLIVPVFQRLLSITTDLGIDLTMPGSCFAPQ